ncbi:hypothetical protein Rsub_03633 [Raphidocelis subcapitata]|uniref:Uncharacterized protein n=1 Tax=Raphidocelis subcapitata TaxID=307507 RepID=A0A2V0P0E0_9CHLO|nr:hypothetical protein Rsub_03633 [Raphidocelis subcapitata]|eukprot:GBF91313.1 hypothetical protein Rsub_03633 [Raphidocelis subcapitata]
MRADCVTSGGLHEQAVGGGLLLGFGGISALSALAVGAEVLGGPKRRGAAGAGAEAAEQEAEAAAAAREVAEAAREAERELRSFDEALRRRERQRQL